MAWNTTQMQSIIDRWNNRRREQVPPELIDRIAPARIEGINLKGIFRFSIERFATKILPSTSAAKTLLTLDDRDTATRMADTPKR